MENLKQKLDDDGFAVIENLFTEKECEEMIQEMKKLSQENSDDSKRIIFSTKNSENQQNKETYFLNSADNISYFYEEGAVDPDGKLTVESNYLALNKVAHALHKLNPIFRKYTFDKRIKEICSKLKMVDPTICQSMFIFKNPKIGGEVIPHQDASYLLTTPQSLIGIWIALEDATLENGCLWFEKGSHKGGIHRRYIKNPNVNSEELFIYVGKEVKYDLSKFEAAPVKRGSCVVIHGQVSHFSKPNKSNKSRNIYTFHLYDRDKTEYSTDNWNYPKGPNQHTSLNNN